MTPPTGYTHALFAGSGVVKVPERRVNGIVIPEAVLGHGDIHVLPVGEAWESANWTPCDGDGKPLPESANPLKSEAAPTPEPPAAPTPPNPQKGGDR